MLQRDKVWKTTLYPCCRETKSERLVCIHAAERQSLEDHSVSMLQRDKVWKTSLYPCCRETKSGRPLCIHAAERQSLKD
ncbi:hypothetical protein DPMN_042158 [Dreissena polymorpha]|uniref:Uncharacterized protein n=1 Tax=Dreissena polymorpha TaxID=45954 RepID=A0A9D4HWT7_DREPO|nr:hypothetical protein DPMN_042158 [Dreissena polymorpha]